MDDLTLPKAHICHHLSTRLRIRIPSQKGERDYFASVAKRLAQAKGIDRLEANPATGSILMMGEALEPGEIARVGREQALFELEPPQAQGVSLSQRLVAPLREVSYSLNRFTKGEVDLAGLAFLALLATGLYQLSRGNFRAPPWYTAFWYAMGIFTKSLVEKREGEPRG